jgi:hypothetical protein
MASTKRPERAGSSEVTRPLGRVLTRPRYGWGRRKWTPIFDALLFAGLVLSSSLCTVYLYKAITIIAEVFHFYN